MSRSYWIKAVAFTLTISFGALAQEEPQQKAIESPAAQEQTAQQPAPETERVARPDAPTEPPAAEHDAHTNRNGDGRTDDGLFWGDGVAQWVIAMTGVLALLISAWAVWLLKKTLEATRDAVQQAEEGTKAAKAAVDETRNTAKHELRAYLAFDGAALDASLRFSCRFFNYGSTPARDVVVAMRTGVGAPNQGEHDIDWSEPITPSPVTLAPNQPMQRDMPLEEAQAAAIQNHEAYNVWFYGHLRLSYTDIFGWRHRVSYFLSSETIQLANPDNNGNIGVGVVEMTEEETPPDHSDQADAS